MPLAMPFGAAYLPNTTYDTLSVREGGVLMEESPLFRLPCVPQYER
jgi:hypothetical protein